MPKRDSSGEPSWPVRVVAPTSVKRSIGSGDGARAGARARDELDPEVLHRRIEALLDHRLQPVDLVDEQDVAAPERRQQARQVALALERRPRGHAHLGPHLARQQVRERRLAQAGRPGQQHVVQRVAALARRLHVDRQVVGDLPLPDELGEAARPQRRVLVAVRAAAPPPSGEHRALGRGRLALVLVLLRAPCRYPSAAPPAPRARFRRRAASRPSSRAAARSRPACSRAATSAP